MSATLHTLNASPRSAAFEDCLHLLAPDDALLLMGDGVYAALAHSSARTALAESGAQLYLLRDDAAAAGILAQLDAAIKIVDIDGFVQLTERYLRQLAWY